MAMILIEKKEIEENGEVLIVETYKSDKTGRESVVKYSKSSDASTESETPQPTQLDRIEAAITASNEEIAQEAIDNYTDMLMEEGVL